MIVPHRFTDALGRAWDVIDIVFGIPPATPGHSVRVPLGSEIATSRVFVPIDPAHHAIADGGIRLYRVHHFELGRAFDDATLEQQLRSVSFWDPRPLAEIQAAVSAPDYH